MLTTLFNRDQTQTELNCQEAFTIWDMLRKLYHEREKMDLYNNYVHDIDFKAILGSIKNTSGKVIEYLEKQSKNFSVPSPPVGVAAIRSNGRAQDLRDEFIAHDVFTDLQSSVEFLLRSLRGAQTHDSLRSFFVNTLKDNVKIMNNMITYLKLKGWINTPPVYPNIPAEVTEQIDVTEAFHLWNLLAFRYMNIHFTKFITAITSSVDFKALLIAGQSILEKQEQALEKECLHFGIPLPVHPPKVVVASTNDNQIPDENIYNDLLGGIINATFQHGIAVKECITNTRIRAMFEKLFMEEIDIEDKLLKYGKLKGYIQLSPRFSVNLS